MQLVLHPALQVPVQLLLQLSLHPPVQAVEQLEHPAVSAVPVQEVMQLDEQAEVQSVQGSFLQLLNKRGNALEKERHRNRALISENNINLCQMLSGNFKKKEDKLIDEEDE